MKRVTPLNRGALFGALLLCGSASFAQMAPAPEGMRPQPGMAGQPMPGHPMAGAHRGPMGPHGYGHGPRGHGGGQRHMGAQGAPMMMLLGPGLDRALDVAKATPEQRAEIRKIAGAARDDLRAARTADRSADRQAWMAAWSGEQLDAAALERQRQQSSAQREAMSRRMMQATVDIGRILKPEQRRALAEHWRSHRPAHRRAEIDLPDHAQPAAD